MRPQFNDCGKRQIAVFVRAEPHASMRPQFNDCGKSVVEMTTRDGKLLQ